MITPDRAATIGRHPAMRAVALAAGAVLTTGVLVLATIVGINLLVRSSTKRSEVIAAPVERVTLTVDGNVTIKPATDGRVRVSRTSTFGLTAPKVATSTVDGVLTVSARCDDAVVAICTNDLVLALPADTDVTIAASNDVDVTGLSGRVDVNAGGGDVTMRGLSGAVTADVAAGSIDGFDLAGGPTLLRSGGGSVSVEFVEVPADLEVTSAAGGIAVRVPRGSAYRVVATAGVGSTQVDVATDPTSPHRIVARSRFGTVDVTYTG